MSTTILTNARLILENEVVAGTIVFDGDRIVALDRGRSILPAAVDMEGDFIAPGLIEMHTDNAEKHFEPRPGVLWPDGLAAIVAHDAQMSAAGVTTVYDSMCAGYALGKRREIFSRVMAAVARGVECDTFRIEHKVHIRCELSGDDLIEQIEPYAKCPLVQLVSLMDHTPGQRQWRDLEAMKRYHIGSGLRTPEEHERDLVERVEAGPRNKAANLPAVLAMFSSRDVPIATHDDTTVADIDEALGAGAVISEFPTTIVAARAAKAAGLVTIGGAPNIVRGGSHSGGVSVKAMHDEAVLDGLSSDYVPSSLLQAVLAMANYQDDALPATMALVTRNIADALRLNDRGRLAAGLRADLVRFRVVGQTPIVRSLWSRGRRTA
jgi:alpha-D-ribose 1-methylphosphonate 5-triphosphate diphosphatase